MENQLDVATEIKQIDEMVDSTPKDKVRLIRRLMKSVSDADDINSYQLKKLNKKERRLHNDYWTLCKKRDEYELQTKSTKIQVYQLYDMMLEMMIRDINLKT